MKWLTLFFASVIGSSVAAAPLIVRTGDHEDFTRVVIQTRGIQDWSAAQAGDEIRITSSEVIDGFDVQRVYERITRDRIADIRANGTELVLSLACPCIVRQVEGGPNIVVFDVFEGTPRPTEDTPLNQDPVAATRNWEDSLSASELLTIDEQAQTYIATASAVVMAPTDEAENSFDEAEAISLPLFPNDDNANRVSFPNTFPRAPNSLDRSDQRQIDQTQDLSALEERLARQIGLAATQGLLTPSLEPGFEPVSSRDRVESDDGETSNRPLDAILSERGASNLTIHNSSSASLAEKLLSSDTVKGLSCETSLFSVGEWNDGMSFTEQIGMLRNRLYGEFDQLDRDAQVSLARAYLFFSLGTEAISVIELDSRETLVDATIISIAQIIENIAPVEALKDFVTCDGDVALWAILGQPMVSDLSYVNSEAALRSINELPYELRAILAPRLSERLRDRGEVANAELAMRSLSRTANSQAPAEQLENAELALLGGDTNSAETGFGNISSDNTLESPQALIRFIDLQIANNREISKETAKLAEAYTVENRETTLYPELRRVHALALAKSGQIGMAIAKLGTADLPEAEQRNLNGQIYGMLASDGSDVLFLSEVLKPINTIRGGLPRDTILELVDRSMALGFIESADQLLQLLPDGAAPRIQALIDGRIALLEQDFQNAIEHASRFEGPEFGLLKADSLFATSNYQEAADIYESLQKPERAAAARWRLQTTNSFTDEPSVVDSPLRSAGVENGSSRPTPSVTQAEGLVDASSALSDQLSTLLAAPDLAVDVDPVREN